MIKKILDLLHEGTFGLFEEYRKKSVEFAKIIAAAFYIQGIKVLRKHLVFLLLLLACVLILAVALVVTPIVLVTMMPLSLSVRIILVFLLGAFFVSATLFFLTSLVSEKRWMRFSGLGEVVDKVTEKDE